MTVFEVDGLLFDLDGTLVDSSANVEAMWHAWADRVGIDVADVLAVSEGRQGCSVAAELTPDRDSHAEDEWIIDYQLKQTGGVQPLAGAREMLDGLHHESGEGWGIVTSCVRELAMARLSAANLPRPPMIVPADDVSESKPAPEGFLLGAERLKLGPDRCLAFEDSAAGLKAAAAAGMPAIALTGATRDRVDAEHSAADWTHMNITAGSNTRWRVELRVS